jgi:hypothetical protein
MFVAASIGAGIFTADRRVGMQSFLSPTVVHFTIALVTCLNAGVPDHTWKSYGASVAAIGVGGTAYSIWIWRRMTSYGLAASIDIFDRIWYAALPVLAYGLLTLSGASFTQGEIRAFDGLATGLILLLLVGIRNAWDMTTWVVQRRDR